MENLLQSLTAETSLAWGWGGISFGFLAGAILGLFVKKPEWLGGYPTEARKYIRLGHIAMVALGMINVLLAFTLKSGFEIPAMTQLLFIVGLIGMPISCFITAAKPIAFYLFPVPAMSLFIGSILLIQNL